MNTNEIWNVEDFIRSLEKKILTPLKLCYPQACGHTQLISPLWVAVYLFIDKDDEKDFGRFVLRINDILVKEGFADFVQHKSDGETFNSREKRVWYFSFWLPTSIRQTEFSYQI
ncbi:MAG: hypothetical protein WCT19_01640 [Candidatus Paceibacterota bacterium]|jgi:hypothetical protein